MRFGQNTSRTKLISSASLLLLTTCILLFTKPQIFQTPSSQLKVQPIFESFNYSQDFFNPVRTNETDSRIENSSTPVLEREFAKKLPVYENAKYGSSRSTNTTNTSFHFRGPNNVGGRTRALALDITNEDIILAGSVSGGMWRSEDAGSSWNRVTSTYVSPSVSSIVQDQRPGKEKTWYYGTGELIGGGGYRSPGDGIFKSNDGGISWSLIESTSTQKFAYLEAPDFSMVNELAIDQSNLLQNEVYAAVDSKIIRTTDGFKTYEIVLGSENPPAESFNTFDWSDVATLSDGTVIATLAGEIGEGALIRGVFISSDGLEWTDISEGSGLSGNSTRIEIAISPSNEDTFYLLSDGGIHHYTISTNTWLNRFNLPQFHNTQNGYNMTIAVHPEDEDVVYAGGVFLIRSTNGFSTKDYSLMHNFSDGTDLHSDIHKMVFYPSDPSKMLVASDGGIASTNDNLTEDLVWKLLNDDYNTTQFNTIAINPLSVTGQLAGGARDNGSFFINGIGEAMDGLPIYGGDGYSAAINYNSILVSAQSGNLGRYIQTGNELELDGWISFREDAPFATTFAIDPVKNDRMVIGAKDGFFLINDERKILDRATWKKFSFIDFGLQIGGGVEAIDFSLIPEGIVVLGTSHGYILKISNLESPTPTIQDITIGQIVGVEPFFNNTSSVSIDPKDANNIIVTNDLHERQSIYSTRDGGLSWTPVGGNLEEFADGSGNGPSVQWVEIMPNGPNHSIYLAGTSVGLYRTDSLDGINTVWERLAPETIGLSPIDMLDIRLVDGTVAVGTYGNGIFESRIDVPLFANIGYSLPQDPAEHIVLRGNKSSSSDYVFEYQWLRDGEEIFGANSSEHLANAGGTYELRLTNTVDDQVSISNPIFLAPSIITAIDESAPTLSNIKVLSNPSDGIFQFIFNEKYASGYKMSVVNINGEEILREAHENYTPGSELELDLRSFPEGLYVLRVTNGEVIDVIKLQKLN